METQQVFPSEVYEKMPPIIQDGLNMLTSETEKAVFLMGAIGVVSGLLPNIQGPYDGQLIRPNIYVYILGPYGCGKGGLRYARELGSPIHREKLKETSCLKGKQQEGGPDPPPRLHYIPANSSKTGFIELLYINKGEGTLFESEGDTLADAIRQKYGNFSDGLRKAAHHEPISYYRRAGNEFVEIENPRLSVILSSTHDQLLALIPRADNGLFSRFCYLTLPPDQKFKNVFDPRKEAYSSRLQDMGERMRNLYNYLRGINNPIMFRFSERQQALFLEYFQEIKTAIQDKVRHDLDGMVHRLGLHFFRIAMIISVMRHSTNIDQNLICSDSDFDLTKQIVEVLKEQALNVYAQLPQPKGYQNKYDNKAEQVERAVKLHEAGHSYRDISTEIFGTDKQKSKIYRWVNNQ